MKWLKRLRLVNWHYFQDEVLEFGKQTLMVGKSGSGKSTIIDALQLVFIADLRLIKFNAAAHEDAKRNLISYLRGKIGAEGHEFLRNYDFTTFLIAEFHDDRRKEPFVVGYVADVSGEVLAGEYHFILANMELSEINILKSDGRLRNRDEFKHVYEGGSRQKYVFETNKSVYQKALLARFGQLHERFFSTFLRAIAFKPLHNVQHFVFDCILDRRELQLDVMRDNFEIHERYKRELEELEYRRDALLEIRKNYEVYNQLYDIANEQDYVIRRLRSLVKEETLQQCRASLTALEAKLEDLVVSIKLYKIKGEEAAHYREEAYGHWQDNREERRKKELLLEIERLKVKQKGLQVDVNALSGLLKREFQALQFLEDQAPSIPWMLRHEDRQILTAGVDIIAIASIYAECNKPLDNLEETSNELIRVGKQLSALGQRISQFSFSLRQQLDQVNERINDLEETIAGLENKRRPYSKELLALKDILEKNLGDRTKVFIFCEEMEVLDEEWRNALEGYLHTQRFDLLVEPAVFADALSIYEREKQSVRLDGVGLVDTEKERRYLGTKDKGSLADTVEANLPVVRAHLEHLLGKVMKATNEQELRLQRTAITSSCMLYQNLVARQMVRERYQVPFIGQKAIERQLELKKAELVGIFLEKDNLEKKISILIGWQEKLSESGERYYRYAEKMTLIADLTSTDFTISERQNDLISLDLREAQYLKTLYEEWVAEEKNLGEERVRLERDHAGRQRDRDHDLVEEQNFLREHLVAEEFCQLWVNENGVEVERKAQLRWETVVVEDSPTYQKLINWDNNRKGYLSRRDKQKDTLMELRRLFNSHHHFEGTIEDEGNDKYNTLLEEIESLDIPTYREKVTAALQESEVQFQSQFIYKLREAIELARREFRELNHALDRFTFSTDRYHFEVIPSERYRKFYDAVMDPNVMERGTLFDFAQDERKQVLHDLFERLIRGEVGELEEFTDYRNYLDYDILITSGGSKYRFSHVLREKSGGETQTPFYIAILASFHHRYSSSETVRFVVFDEAFSKMDEERIRSSLQLIRQMNLQLILAAPDEKLPLILPEVTTTLVVNKVNHHCFVDLLDYDSGVTAYLEEASVSVEQTELF